MITQRYLVFGAGAIGATIGGHLARAGGDVTLLARGAHLAAMRDDGLELRTARGSSRVAVRVAGRLAEVGLRDGDVVILAVKSQDSAAALDELAALGVRGLHVVCAQNGVDSERQALRLFEYTYGMCVMMPVTQLEPGVVDLRSGTPGVLDLGRYPSGVDEVAEAVAADLTEAGIASRAQPQIMRRKYRKLLANLGNVLDAAAGRGGWESPLLDAARAEAQACFAAAGIDVATVEEDAERRKEMSSAEPGGHRGGSSSWQSLARGTGRLETAYLNGEIVLLGRLHGVPTPANRFLADLAVDLLRRGVAAGSMTITEIEEAAGRKP